MSGKNDFTCTLKFRGDCMCTVRAYGWGDTTVYKLRIYKRFLAVHGYNVKMSVSYTHQWFSFRFYLLNEERKRGKPTHTHTTLNHFFLFSYSWWAELFKLHLPSLLLHRLNNRLLVLCFFYNPFNFTPSHQEMTTSSKHKLWNIFKTKQ